MSKIFGYKREEKEKKTFGEIENGDLFFLDGTLFAKVEDTKGLILGNEEGAFLPMKKGETMEFSPSVEVILSIVDFCV